MASQQNRQTTHTDGTPSFRALSSVVHAPPDPRPGMSAAAVPSAPAGEAALAALRRENAHLREALTSRAVIDQARGVLILRYGIDEERAFLVLQRWSQHHNTDVRRIAETLVSGICQGRDTADFDVTLMRWLEEQLRKDPEITPASP
jgi:ANTAR domain